jgi:hypothetical protein
MNPDSLGGIRRSIALKYLFSSSADVISTHFPDGTDALQSALLRDQRTCSEEIKKEDCDKEYRLRDGSGRSPQASATQGISANAGHVRLGSKADAKRHADRSPLNTRKSTLRCVSPSSKRRIGDT